MVSFYLLEAYSYNFASPVTVGIIFVIGAGVIYHDMHKPFPCNEDVKLLKDHLTTCIAFLSAQEYKSFLISLGEEVKLKNGISIKLISFCPGSKTMPPEIDITNCARLLLHWRCSSDFVLYLLTVIAAAYTEYSIQILSQELTYIPANSVRALRFRVCQLLSQSSNDKDLMLQQHKTFFSEKMWSFESFDISFAVYDYEERMNLFKMLKNKFLQLLEKGQAESASSEKTNTTITSGNNLPLLPIEDILQSDIILLRSKHIFHKLSSYQYLSELQELTTSIATINSMFTTLQHQQDDSMSHQNNTLCASLNAHIQEVGGQVVPRFCSLLCMNELQIHIDTLPQLATLINHTMHFLIEFWFDDMITVFTSSEVYFLMKVQWFVTSFNKLTGHPKVIGMNSNSEQQKGRLQQVWQIDRKDVFEEITFAWNDTMKGNELVFRVIQNAIFTTQVPMQRFCLFYLNRIVTNAATPLSTKKSFIQGFACLEGFLLTHFPEDDIRKFVKLYLPHFDTLLILNQAGNKTLDIFQI